MISPIFFAFYDSNSTQEITNVSHNLSCQIRFYGQISQIPPGESFYLSSKCAYEIQIPQRLVRVSI